MADDQSKVDGLCGQQPVALRRHSQRQRTERGLRGVGTELKLVDGRQQRRIIKRAAQREEGHRQGGRRLALEYQLVANGAVDQVDWVLLAVIYASFHRPLVAVRREPGRLVVEFRNEVVGAVWTQLDVCLSEVHRDT